VSVKTTLPEVGAPSAAYGLRRSAALPLLAAAAAVAAVGAGAGGELLGWAAGGLAGHWWRAILIGGLYLLPGLALLRLLWPAAGLAPAARLALAVPLSAALPPVLLLLFETLGLPWGAVATWGYLLVSLAICCGLWAADSGVLGRQAGAGRGARVAPEPAGGLAGLALLGVCVAGLLARLYVVRELPAGLFGDSYHHTLIAQLLVDNRGLFRSWEPYAPLTSFTYHFGFHANAAFIHWLTGAPVTTSVVWAGQVLNAAAAPAAFALVVVALRGSPWAGVWAAVVTAFVLTIPAYYVVWGRYTQLTGQVVLVAVVVCWARLADRSLQLANSGAEESRLSLRSALADLRAGWRPILLTGLVTAAMLLTHYLVTVFAALFVASYLLAGALARRSWRAIGRLALAGGLAAGLALLVAAPWLLNLTSGMLVRNAAGFTNGEVDAARVASYTALPLVTPLYAKGYVLLAALAGLLVAVWRREWRVALPALWAALLVLCVVPQVVGLPGAGAIDHLTGLSALYLPLAPLAGYALAALQAAFSNLEARFTAGGSRSVESDAGGERRVVDEPQRTTLGGRRSISAASAALRSLVLAGALLAVTAWGTSWQNGLIDGSTQLVSRADVAAMEWIREQTPPDARFLVNAFPAYGGTLVAGNDAGWWLPLLAGRQSTLPPLTYGSERGPYDRYEWEVGLLYQELRGRRLTDARPVALDLTAPEAVARLRELGVTHVYSGAIASPGPDAADRIDTAKLRASADFRLVYERDGVEIFELVRR